MQHASIRSVMFFLAVCAIGTHGIPFLACAAEDAKPAFTLVPDEHGMVLKTPDGRTVFGYMTKKPAVTNLTANSVCCLYPLNTPSGERAVDFAPGDHRHHRGVFLAWHSTKGKVKADFWGWGSWAPTEGRVIKNRSAKLTAADREHAVLQVQNNWMVEDDVMIREATSVTACETQGVYVVDMEFKLTAAVDVTLDQTAFGGFCVKGRKDGEAFYCSPDGKVDLPNPHHLKPETDWPAADWYAYIIKLESGKTVGIAVLNHPENPPSTWHNLHPIAMVNPCIVAPGPVAIKKGDTLTLRYRLGVHDGPAPLDVLKKLNDEWRCKSRLPDGT